MAIGVAQPFGKPAAQRPRRLPPGNATAPVPDPTATRVGWAGPGQGEADACRV